MRKRRNHDAGFKARVVPAALKGDRTVSGLAAGYGVYPAADARLSGKQSPGLLSFRTSSLPICQKPNASKIKHLWRSLKYDCV